MREIVRKFCAEYELDFHECFRLEVVDDISEYIRKDDVEYYHDRKEQIECAYGMLYEDSSGQLIILEKVQDEVNFLATLLHEYVHLCDYTELSKNRNNANFRGLQEDYVFLYWTEFHATYLSYRFLLDMNPDGIVVESVRNEIVGDLQKYYSSQQNLDKNNAMDKTVRSYGSYIALYEKFSDEVVMYPRQYYLNETFLKIYNFLMSYKKFEAFILKYDDFKELILKI